MSTTVLFTIVLTAILVVAKFNKDPETEKKEDELITWVKSEED